MTEHAYKKGKSVDDKTGQKQPTVLAEELGQCMWKGQCFSVDKSLSYSDRETWFRYGFGHVLGNALQ